MATARLPAAPSPPTAAAASLHPAAARPAARQAALAAQAREAIPPHRAALAAVAHRALLHVASVVATWAAHVPVALAAITVADGLAVTDNE